MSIFIRYMLRVSRTEYGMISTLQYSITETDFNIFTFMEISVISCVFYEETKVTAVFHFLYTREQLNDMVQ